MTRSDLNRIIDALAGAIDFTDNYVDVLDGDYGEPRPNKAMSLFSGLQDALEIAERTLATLPLPAPPPIATIGKRAKWVAFQGYIVPDAPIWPPAWTQANSQDREADVCGCDSCADEDYLAGRGIF